MASYTGTVERFFFRGADGAAAGLLRTEHGDVIKFRGPLAAFGEGLLLHVEGEWASHPKYGDQLVVSAASAARVPDAEALRNFLVSGQVFGVNKVLGQRIADHFGDRLPLVLRETPEELADVPGIGPSRVDSITTALREKQSFLSLLQLLADMNIPAALAQTLVKFSNPEELIRERPYSLALYGDIDFSSLDEIGRAAGVGRGDLPRLLAALYFAVKAAENEGDTLLEFLPAAPPADPQLLPEECEYLSADLVDVINGRDGLLERPVMEDWSPASNDFLRRLSIGGSERDTFYVQRAVMTDAEGVIRRVVHRPHELEQTEVDVSDAIAYAESCAGVELNEDQILAARRALSLPFSVVTGGPGVGKTTTMRAVVQGAVRLGLQVCIAAPTGKAALQVTKASGMYATTVHSLLGLTPGMYDVEPGALGGPDTLLIVDESSMLDTQLAGALLSAAESCRILLVGDADQLPSVGPGQVFREIVEAPHVPVTRLTQIYRQREGSEIVYNAYRILRGEPLKEGDDVELVFDGVERNTEHFVSEILPCLLAQFDFDDIQLLSPVYKGELGINSLNDALADWHATQLGVPSDMREVSPFFIGERVINLKNGERVMNGQIGKVIDLLQEDDKPVLAVQYEGIADPVYYTGEQHKLLAPAYAISIHKSQGSEFPCVVLCCPSRAVNFFDRNMLYTGLTRAQTHCVLYGSRRVLTAALANTRSRRRVTNLAL